MTDFDLSFELLSSMSPKFKSSKSTKKLKKSPHKLSLKSHIRRSFLLDKVPHSHHVRDSSIIILDDSVISDKLSPSNVKILKTPIIISSTSESECSGTKDDVVKPSISVQPKYIDIDNWLSENEKVDGYSEVFSFKHNSFSESDEEKITATVSTKSTTEENNPCGSWQVVTIETTSEKEPLRSFVPNTDKVDKDFNISADIIEDSDTEQNIFAENMLDDLYGTSWRINQDKVLTRSEPRRRLKRSPIQMPQTENKLRQKTKTENKSPWQQALKNICDSDSEESTSVESVKSTGNFSNNCKQLSFSNSEDESDIDYHMTPPTSISKTNSKTSKKYISKNSINSSRSSDEIRFSENDRDSLGTRVRKKLAKKAKTLYDDKSTNKKINSESKQNKFFTKNATDKKTDKTNNHNNKTPSSENAIKTPILDKNKKLSFLKSLSGGIPPWSCHPDAQIFKTKYKTEKSALARKLFNLYNEKIFGNAIPVDTPLEWNDRMRGTAGFCYNKRITRRDGTMTRSCRIALSSKVLDTADRLRDTLVHEMCHAATWLVNNVADGHGPYWKSWANKAMNVFPELPPIKRCHDYQINTKYTYKCTECGYSIGRHSKSLDIERKRCGYCYGKFEIYINKTTKTGEKQSVPATPKGKTTAFATYVKENYGLVKRSDMKHAEVMKVLGQKFAELKVNKK